MENHFGQLAEVVFAVIEEIQHRILHLQSFIQMQAEMYTLITFRKAVEYRKGAENECERKSSGLPAGGEVKAKSEAGRTNWVDLQAEQDESRRQSKNQSQIKSAYDVAEKILLGG